MTGKRSAVAAPEKLNNPQPSKTRKTESNSTKKNEATEKEKIGDKVSLPKTPPSSFSLYIDDITLKCNNPNPDHMEILQIGAEKWKLMSVSEKAEYEEESQKRREEYEKAMIEYRKAMMSENEVIVIEDSEDSGSADSHGSSQ